MKTIENGFVKCVKDNERVYAKPGDICEVRNGFIIERGELGTNFGNCARRFRKASPKETQDMIDFRLQFGDILHFNTGE